MDRHEAFNSISHLIGAVAALIGAAVLVVYAGIDGDVRRIVSFSVYGTTLFCSTCFPRFITARTGARAACSNCSIIRRFIC